MDKMMKMTRKSALELAISALMNSTADNADDACAVLTKMVEQLDAKASKAGGYASKAKAKGVADRCELGNLLADAITDTPMTLTELIKASGLEISTQKAVRCLAEVGIKGEVVKGRKVYALPLVEVGE